MKHASDDRHRLGAPDSLRTEMEQLGLILSEEVLAGCLAHWELLTEAARGRNLISSGDLEKGPVRHTGDALACLVRWPLVGTLRLLDVGSGGGFPGIPLAIARPELSVTLLEGRERKADWLERAVRELGLRERVSIVTGRLEDQPPGWAAQYEVVTARAVAPPDELLTLVLPELKKGGQLLLWHSDRQRQTIQAMIDKENKMAVYEIQDSVSHLFESIDFITNITCVRRVR